MRYKFISFFLVISLLTFFCTGCPKSQSNPNPQSGLTLEQRAVRAVAAVPGVVRVLFPNANPTTLGIIDSAGAIFTEFMNNPSASNWQKAQNAWDRARLQLLNFNSTQLKQIVGAVDILVSQVFVPDSTTNTRARGISSASVTVQFKEEDVEKLENLVKVQRE